MTRKGIEYNLEISPYTIKEDNLTLFFSSDLHKQKYLNGIEHFLDVEIQKFEKRLKCKISGLEPLLKIKYYSTIESRGFLLLNEKGIKFSCQQNILAILGGVTLILKK